MSESNQSSDNPDLDLKIDAIPNLLNSKPDQERSASDVQDDQESKINKYNNDKPITEKVHPQQPSASSLSAMPIGSEPDQERSVSDVQNDQEKAINKCNNDKFLNQKVHSQYQSDPSLDIKTDAMPVIDPEKSVSSLFQAMSHLHLKGNFGCINAQNIQIGNDNTMHISAEDTKKKVTRKKFDPEKEFKRHLESGKILKTKDLTRISKFIGNKWKAIGRHLDIEDHKLDTIQYDYNKEGLDEIVYQMLRLWSKKSPSTCTVGTLARAFIDTENLELIHELPLDD